jgi:hypothetical protein
MWSVLALVAALLLAGMALGLTLSWRIHRVVWSLERGLAAFFLDLAALLLLFAVGYVLRRKKRGGPQS